MPVLGRATENVRGDGWACFAPNGRNVIGFSFLAGLLRHGSHGLHAFWLTFPTAYHGIRGNVKSSQDHHRGMTNR